MLKRIKQFVIEWFIAFITMTYMLSIGLLVQLTFSSAPLSPLLIFTDILVILVMIPKRFYYNLLKRKEAYNPRDSLYMFITALIIIFLGCCLCVQYYEYFHFSPFRLIQISFYISFVFFLLCK